MTDFQPKPQTPEEVANGLRELYDAAHKAREEQREQLKEIRQSFLSGNYKIICDETNNTPQDIENGVINVTICEVYDEDLF